MSKQKPVKQNKTKKQSRQKPKLTPRLRVLPKSLEPRGIQYLGLLLSNDVLTVVFQP